RHAYNIPVGINVGVNKAQIQHASVTVLVLIIKLKK
ncbi:hypothetical protein SS7213T_05191, partial [Staphylococcus simiae CCM 7213 = CCUG 51256]